MSVAIRVNNLSKAYQIGQIGTGTISRDIERWVAKVRGKEDPFLKIGQENDRTKKSDSDVVWSLRDINFDIQQGDAVGIIGRNGAGKSTLLKLLSRVTSPTTGDIKVKGRIASLLEVGTGFHPELTGRENIYLNGAILGMRKKEIDRKFDQIVDFSGVERYIDTPVKKYSSGMYVRLAFAVAAHLESEILIVDEVLAVGDAEFQTKCLGKMKDVSTNQGRTVLFVSHNMSAIQKLCTSGILLSKGSMLVNGDINTVLNTYVSEGEKGFSEYLFERNIPGKIGFVSKVRIEDLEGKSITEIPIGKPWRVKVSFTINAPVKNLIVALGMINNLETPIRTSWNLPQDFIPGNYVAYFEETELTFSSGRYRFAVGLRVKNQTVEYVDENIYITISDMVEKVDDSVVLKDIGILLNPMKMHIENDI